MNAMLVAVGVLVATYAAVMSEKLNRSIVALLGALLMIVLASCRSSRRSMASTSTPSACSSA
jgi:Na+/H+ antiporter NhaD/arsenite permease-like protein